ncbi:alginate export family protein [Ferruginibacter profundus]
MKKIFFILIIHFYQVCSYAQTLPAFKPLRYDEDYSILKKDSSLNWYKKAKYNPLSVNGETYISLGGEIRYQYFYFKNENWGGTPKDKDGYILTRYLAHADFHSGKYTRFFLQLQSSLANGKINKPSGVDENQLDLHQAFIDIVLPVVSMKQKLLLRFGRQELLYGSQRLVAVRDGPNNRQSFDAAKLMYTNNHFKADIFFSHYVLSKQNIFDDGFNKTTKFWGTYIAVNKIPVLQNADFYYLGLSKAVTTFDDGKGKEVRHSIGSRIWKKTGNWQYDFEGLYQFGKFASKNISAWTISSNTSYSFNSLKLKPQIGLKTELITGDKNYDDNKLNSFNPLFPRGAYFGLAALIGPSNLQDIHPSVSFDLSKQIELTIDYDAFWRYSCNDGIYAPSTALIYTGRNINSKFIGQQYATELTYTPGKFLYFRAEFTWFKSGSYLKIASPGKDILFTGFTAQLKF